MARAGHRTARAGLIYQHAAEERNAVLAEAMDAVGTSTECASRLSKRWPRSRDPAGDAGPVSGLLRLDSKCFARGDHECILGALGRFGIIAWEGVGIGVQGLQDVIGPDDFEGRGHIGHLVVKRAYLL